MSALVGQRSPRRKGSVRNSAANFTGQCFGNLLPSWLVGSVKELFVKKVHLITIRWCERVCQKSWKTKVWPEDLLWASQPIYKKVSCISLRKKERFVKLLDKRPRPKGWHQTPCEVGIIYTSKTDLQVERDVKVKMLIKNIVTTGGFGKPGGHYLWNQPSVSDSVIGGEVENGKSCTSSHWPWLWQGRCRLLTN